MAAHGGQARSRGTRTVTSFRRRCVIPVSTGGKTFRLHQYNGMSFASLEKNLGVNSITGSVVEEREAAKAGYMG